MWISKVTLRNIQSYEYAEVKFSRGINIILGENNSGKSTILKSLYRFQENSFIEYQSLLRKRSGDGAIAISLSDSRNKTFENRIHENVTVEKDTNHLLSVITDNGTSLDFLTSEEEFVLKDAAPRDAYRATHPSVKRFHPFKKIEPDNLIYPFFSRRKTQGGGDKLNTEATFGISEDLKFLAQRFAKATNDSYPYIKEFKDAVKEILNIDIGIISHDHFPKLGSYVDSSQTIPLELMGEGVTNILGLLTILYTDSNKVFLIEELENDIHPTALKKLLNLIVEKSMDNQFIITTHSNIVTSYLGSAVNSKLFVTKVQTVRNDVSKAKLPTSTVFEVDESPDSRAQVLSLLGYELADMYMYDGFLILEEPSADIIIRNFLIPEFAPKLSNRLGIVSAKGAADVAPRFIELHRLFTYLHVSHVYNKKAWVFVDNDTAGKVVIDKLISDFKTWDPSHFQTFSRDDFEEYYPGCYETEIANLKSEVNNVTRGKLKVDLAKKIVADYRSGKILKEDFEVSARDVIEKLRLVEQSLNNHKHF